jgi:hypothetical protein
MINIYNNMIDFLHFKTVYLGLYKRYDVVSCWKTEDTLLMYMCSVQSNPNYAESV